MTHYFSIDEVSHELSIAIGFGFHFESSSSLRYWLRFSFLLIFLSTSPGSLLVVGAAASDADVAQEDDVQDGAEFNGAAAPAAVPEPDWLGVA